jgi:hypothetical protein
MNDIRNLTITSTHPCLIVYLIDQSGSMSDLFGNANHSKSVELAKAINSVVYEVGLRCIGSAGVLKNRFEIAIIGYGKNGDIAHSGWEGALANKWVVSVKNIFDYPLGEENGMPIWIRPYANGGTPMKNAFENAVRLCKDWIDWGNHRECHPPIIINVTDGEATDAGNNFVELKNMVQQLKNMGTNYGKINIFNIHISSVTGDRILFPQNLPNVNDRLANLLFEMSTPLSENMIRIARQKGYRIDDEAKGYIFNGDANDLINFLNIGTPQ